MLKIKLLKKKKAPTDARTRTNTRSHFKCRACAKGDVNQMCRKNRHSTSPAGHCATAYESFAGKKKERSKSNREAIENVWDGKLSNGVLGEEGEMY